jgi:NhaA family Na+:H+ antiporter
MPPLLPAIREFLRLEVVGGVALVAAALVALIWANSPIGPLYKSILETPVSVQVGALILAKPLLLWINDGLMAIFFLIIGLEIKREILDGELSDLRRAATPAFAAVGGMLVPALVYAVLNWGDPYSLRGWAIPTATDIAFALGALALVGSRVPTSLKVFLLALAIMDDLGAIVVIAVFYTSDLSVWSLAFAAGAVATLVVFNVFGVTRIAPYVLAGVFLWLWVLQSGVHATLAGVVIGLTVPLRASNAHGESPLNHLEHILHPWVAFGVLPLFAFANAGVRLHGLEVADLFEPVPLGIALGLFVGKQIGVMGAAWLAVRTRIGALPEDASWLQFYGVALLTGIGFTMSLFIGTLAFEGGTHADAVRIGVLIGSALSAAAGFAVLRHAVRSATYAAIR